MSNPASNSAAAVIEKYEELAHKYGQEAEAAGARHFQYSVARLCIFVFGIGLTIYALSISWFAVVGLSTLWIAAFAYCIITQFRIDSKRNHLLALQEINLNEINVITQGSNVYYDGLHYLIPKHFYAHDLDLFGPFSLYKILNRAKTFRGQELLASWLSSSSKTSDILNRQKAVQKLQSDLSFRQELQSLLFSLQGREIADPLPTIAEGLKGDLSFASFAPLKLYRTLLPIIWLAIGIAYYYWGNIGYISALLVGLLNFILSLRYSLKVSQVQSKLSGSILRLDTYADAFYSIIQRRWDDTYVKNLVDQIRKNKDPQESVTAIKDLQKLMTYLDYRLHMIPAMVLNIGLLWDTKILNKIDQWRNMNQSIFTEVFEIIGQVEALVSLSCWADNNDKFQYPNIDDEHFHLKGLDLIHPLMQDQAVSNDFQIKKEEHVSIITGSNMSGKSTLLRTIGLNIVLGQAGTKIAGRQFHFSNVQLVTYMRIKDALEENVSTFKAELDRVSLILELIQSSKPCFILIDEMLRGTNSKDKLRGSIAITKQMLKHKAYAMIATHDIKLAELAGDFPIQIQNYYFDIDFLDGELVFDYKVKEGICDNFNASFLLEKMGLQLGQ